MKRKETSAELRKGEECACSGTHGGENFQKTVNSIGYSERPKKMKTKIKKGGSYRWPFISLGKHLFIVLYLQPLPLSAQTHIFPCFLLDLFPWHTPELPTPSAPSLQPPIRQTPDSFTCSPYPSRLHHHPSTQLSIIPESFPPSLYARVDDPLNISLTNLSSRTSRLQP